ncbi:MAG: hypothetical protein AAFQ36_02945 [Pseudomonadota bacterium]
MMQFFEFDGAAVAPQPDETLAEYWLSYAPVAPLFGVEYRPAKIWNFQFDAAVPAPATPSVKTPVVDAEVVEAPAEPAPEPAAAPVEAAVEEPVAEVAAEEPAPVEAAPAPTAEDSDLVQIKGIGPKLQIELNGLGLFTVAQLATYTDAQVAELSAGMSSFKDRPVRDDWVGQAKALSA